MLELLFPKFDLSRGQEASVDVSNCGATSEKRGEEQWINTIGMDVIGASVFGSKLGTANKQERYSNEIEEGKKRHGQLLFRRPFEIMTWRTPIWDHRLEPYERQTPSYC